MRVRLVWNWSEHNGVIHLSPASISTSGLFSLGDTSLLLETNRIISPRCHTLLILGFDPLLEEVTTTQRLAWTLRSPWRLYYFKIPKVTRWSVSSGSWGVSWYLHLHSSGCAKPSYSRILVLRQDVIPVIVVSNFIRPWSWYENLSYSFIFETLTSGWYIWSQWIPRRS